MAGFRFCVPTATLEAQCNSPVQCFCRPLAMPCRRWRITRGLIGAAGAALVPGMRLAGVPGSCQLQPTAVLVAVWRAGCGAYVILDAVALCRRHLSLLHSRRQHIDLPVTTRWPPTRPWKWPQAPTAALVRVTWSIPARLSLRARTPPREHSCPRRTTYGFATGWPSVPPFSTSVTTSAQLACRVEMPRMTRMTSFTLRQLTHLVKMAVYPRAMQNSRVRPPPLYVLGRAPVGLNPEQLNTGLLRAGDVPHQTSSYWAMKSAADNLVRDYTTMLFWIREMEKTTPRPDWKPNAAAG